MVTRNDYNLKLMNGDVGLCLAPRQWFARGLSRRAGRHSLGVAVKAGCDGECFCDDGA